MKTPVQMPLGTTLGLMPPTWLQWYLELTHAGAAGAIRELHTLPVAQVGSSTRSTAPENNYVPFTIAKCDGQGGWKAKQSVHVHYANVDTGAQVCCTMMALLNAFLHLAKYY